MLLHSIFTYLYSNIHFKCLGAQVSIERPYFYLCFFSLKIFLQQQTLVISAGQTVARKGTCLDVLSAETNRLCYEK